MNNNLIKLQKTIKVKNIEKIANIFYKLELSKKKSNFDKFTRVMMNKTVLNITRLFLYKINRIFNETVLEKSIERIFLTCYLIYLYPETILSKNLSNLEKEIFEISKKLVIKTDKLCRNINSKNLTISYLFITSFKKTFNEFSILFQIWKDIDLNNILELLLERYCSIMKSIDFIKNKSKFDEITKKESIDILNEQIIDLKKKAKSIEKNFDLKYFDKYYKIHISVKNKFENAYWDIMAENIKNDNYESIIIDLKDIVEKICSYIHNKKKKNTQEIIRNELNEEIEIIEQLLENRMFTNKNVKKYTKKIFYWLKLLNAKSRENDFDDLWNNINDNLEECFLIPQIFKLFFEMINLLDKDLENIS